jgi:cysteine synthase
VRSICAIPVDKEQAFSSKIPGVADRASVFLDWKQLETISVPENLALDVTRQMIRCRILAGPSSGLNIVAASLSATAEPLESDECIVTFLPDRAERYLQSHPALFAA